MKVKECWFRVVLGGVACPFLAAASPVFVPAPALPPVVTPAPATCRASDLIGSPVVDTHQQKVGRLSNMIFDLRHNRVCFAVVTTSEDERRIAVPMADILSQPGDNSLMLACDQQKFRAAGDFSSNDLQDPKWVSSTYSYFNVTQPAEELASTETTIVEPAGAEPPPPVVNDQQHDREMGRWLDQYQLGKGEARQMDEKHENGAPPQTSDAAENSATTNVAAPAPSVTLISPAPPATCFIRSSDLIGAAVVDASGLPVGDIKDAMVDWPAGRVLFAVLDPSGELAVNDSYIPVATEALHRTLNGGALAVAMPRGALLAAPKFDRAQWAAATDPSFVASVYRFYDHTSN